MSYARLVVGEPSWNNHVYQASQQFDIRFPDIPVPAVELYGQAGEDLIIAALLEAKALLSDVKLKEKRYLEVGGNHPFATSATFLLARRLGMKGVIVEANPDLLDDLRRGRPDDVIVHGAVQTEDVESVTFSVSNLSEISSLDQNFVEHWAGGAAGQATRIEVPALRMNDLVREHLQGEAPVFLSIDVEGMDLQLLQDFDFTTFRPWLVQVEPSDDYIPGNTKHIIEHMRDVGYELIAKTWVNLILRDVRG